MARVQTAGEGQQAWYLVVSCGVLLAGAQMFPLNSTLY